MQRLAPLTEETANEAQKPLLEMLPGMKLFRTMAHAPEVTEGFVQHGMAILFKSKLDAVWREIVILAVAHSRNNAYEIHEHERIAAEVGCAEEKVRALVDCDEPWTLEVLSEQERALVRYALEMVRDGAPGDAAYRAAADILDEQELVELTLCVAYYWGAAMFIDAFGLTPESAEFSDNVKMDTTP